MRKTLRVLLIATVVLLILGLFVVRPWLSSDSAQTTPTRSAIAP